MQLMVPTWCGHVTMTTHLPAVDTSLLPGSWVCLVHLFLPGCPVSKTSHGVMSLLNATSLVLACVLRPNKAMGRHNLFEALIDSRVEPKLAMFENFSKSSSIQRFQCFGFWVEKQSGREKSEKEQVEQEEREKRSEGIKMSNGMKSAFFNVLALLFPFTRTAALPTLPLPTQPPQRRRQWPSPVDIADSCWRSPWLQWCALSLSLFLSLMHAHTHTFSLSPWTPLKSKQVYTPHSNIFGSLSLS